MDWRSWWYDKTGRLRSGWRALLFLALAFPLATVLASFFIDALPQSVMRHEFLKGFYTQLAISAAFAVVFTGAGIWAVRTFDRLPPRTLGMSFEGAWGGMLVGGFGLGFALITLALLVLQVWGFAAFKVAAGMPNMPFILLAAVGSFFLFAVEEEIVIHGYLFQTLLRGIGPLLALVVTSVLFAAVHMLINPNPTMLGITNIFLAGMAFGLLYLRLGSLWLPIGLHTGWNIALYCFHTTISGIAPPPTPTPFIATFTGHPLLTGGLFGPEGSLPISIALLGLIAVTAFAKRGLSLASAWWEWHDLIVRPRLPSVWDFSIDSRYYQWKLLSRDQSE